MKITGKKWIEIIGAEGTKHPMYIKGSMEGAKEVVYLADAKASGYVRRKLGNAWVYMHEEDAKSRATGDPNKNPITNLVAQRDQLKAELAARDAADKKKAEKRERDRESAAKRRLENRIKKAAYHKETPSEKIERLEETIRVLEGREEALEEQVIRLEEENGSLKKGNRDLEQDEAYAAWYMDSLTAEKEILKGQNETMKGAVKSIGKRVSVLADPAVAEFVDNADGAEISVHRDVKGGHIETVLRARKSIEK